MQTWWSNEVFMAFGRVVPREVRRLSTLLIHLQGDRGSPKCWRHWVSKTPSAVFKRCLSLNRTGCSGGPHLNTDYSLGRDAIGNLKDCSARARLAILEIASSPSGTVYARRSRPMM